MGSIDCMQIKAGEYDLYSNHGKKNNGSLDKLIDELPLNYVGDIYLQSMVKDGTGQGLDFDLYKKFSSRVENPIILSGGVGTSQHFIDAFMSFGLKSVATAHLFNFIGAGLQNARTKAIDSNVNLAMWGK